MDYANPLRFPLLPLTIGTTYRRDDYSLWKSTFTSPPITLPKNKFFFGYYETIKPTYIETKEIGDDFSAKLNFQFWSGFVFNPSYALKKVREEKIQEKLKYRKSLSQTVGFGANLRLLNWFKPDLSYSITSREDTDLATVRSTETLKRIDRSATGNVGCNFAAREIIPRFRPTQSLTLSTSFRIEHGDSYEKVPMGIKTLKKLWIPSRLYLLRKSYTKRDTLGLSSRWSPLETIPFPRRLSPFNTLSVMANYIDSKEYSETTGTTRETRSTQWPDLVLTLFKSEYLIYQEKRMSDSQLNFKVLHKVTTTKTVSRTINDNYSTDYRFLFVKKYQLYFDYTTTINREEKPPTTLQRLTQTQSTTGQINFNIRIWRFTLRNEYKLDTEKDSYGKLTREDKTLSPSLQVYANFALPAQLRIPLIKKTIALANQLVFNSTLRWDRKRSRITLGANTDTCTLSTSIDYTLSSNSRMNLGVGASRFWNRDDKKMDYYSYEGTMQIIIQF